MGTVGAGLHKARLVDVAQDHAAKYRAVLVGVPGHGNHAQGKASWGVIGRGIVRHAVDDKGNGPVIDVGVTAKSPATMS